MDGGAGSRTYEFLSEVVANDQELLDLARRCRVGQPIPNLLFAAVKRAVASFPGSALADHYLRIASGQRPTQGLAPAFVEFAAAHRDLITGYLETRMVQTNEVGRCAYLMPGFMTVAAENPGRPLGLLDVGASAGLNLNWDLYRYRYTNAVEYGPAESSVLIECEARNGLPKLPQTFPRVNFRLGIDLEPVDLSDDEEYEWMQALVWPEHRDRRALLSAAKDVWLRSRPTIWRGDAVQLLPAALAAAPEDSALCVFHCHTLNQFSAAGRERFESVLHEASARRVVYHLSSEGQRVSLVRIERGMTTSLLAARAQIHGKWISLDTDARVSHGSAGT